MPKKKKTPRATAQDRRLRSKEPWERGRGAKRKGNPRYMRVIRKGRAVYIVRPKKKK